MFRTPRFPRVFAFPRSERIGRPADRRDTATGTHELHSFVRPPSPIPFLFVVFILRRRWTLTEPRYLRRTACFPCFLQCSESFEVQGEAAVNFVVGFHLPDRVEPRRPFTEFGFERSQFPVSAQ